MSWQLSTLETKHELFSVGKLLVAEFCRLNGFTIPHMRDDRCYGSCGQYSIHSKKIIVTVGKCAHTVVRPTRQWSFPGYKVDRTPYGVVCHEAGHYIDHMCIRKGLPRLSVRRISAEPAITGYDKGNSISEHFAEAFRLFLTNPDLLRRGRPLRYKYFTETLGLKPTINLQWDEVLCYAHQKIINAAGNWIGAGHV